MDRQRQEIFLFSTPPRLALGPNQPPARWLPGAVSPELKLTGREADNSPPSSAEVKNDGTTPPLLHTSSWHGA
jgi:hypothetical protein